MKPGNMLDLITEVKEDHVLRLDVPIDDLTPKPRHKRKPARTVLLSIEASKAYQRRLYALQRKA